jgi:hypothetical protein
VLGVPPAFVLSQDQTLYKSCISKTFLSFEILLITIARNYRFFSLFWLLIFLYSRNFKGIIFSIVQFSRCCAVRDSLIIISQLQDFVKHFFEKFLFYLFVAAVSFKTAFQLYHIFSHLSTPFQKFLQIFPRCSVDRFANLFIIPHIFKSVKYFSQLFWNVFLPSGFSISRFIPKSHRFSCLTRRLDNYIISGEFCQQENPERNSGFFVYYAHYQKIHVTPTA